MRRFLSLSGAAGAKFLHFMVHKCLGSRCECHPLAPNDQTVVMLWVIVFFFVLNSHGFFSHGFFPSPNFAWFFWENLFFPQNRPCGAQISHGFFRMVFSLPPNFAWFFWKNHANSMEKTLWSEWGHQDFLVC